MIKTCTYSYKLKFCLNRRNVFPRNQLFSNVFEIRNFSQLNDQRKTKSTLLMVNEKVTLFRPILELFIVVYIHVEQLAKERLINDGNHRFVFVPR